jgi:hypothetical protein
VNAHTKIVGSYSSGKKTPHQESQTDIAWKGNTDPPDLAAKNQVKLDADLRDSKKKDYATFTNPEAQPTDKNLYAHALAILAIDREVDTAIIKITKRLNASEITATQAQSRIEQLETDYKKQVFVLNRTEHFQGRILFSQVIAERHEKVIMSNISDPDGALSDPVVRSRMPTVTFTNLFYDLSAAQMERLTLLKTGLKREIRSGIESARPIYDEQLTFANQYRKARASVDRILAAPD